MELLKITGGKPLHGTVKAAGAKNAVTKLLIASLLSDKKCILRNVPNIQEVEVTVELCREIGSEITWDREAKVLEIQTKHFKTAYVPQRFSGANRIPILMIGALLGRIDEDIIVPTAGGCKIGKRPVDFHIEALEKLGANIEHRVMKKEGAYLARAHHGLHGAEIVFSYPSVGATENTLLAASRAKGTTIIRNAAIEPELLDLILFLQKLGVAITFDSDRTIRVMGAKEFYEVDHEVISDRIEAASLGMAAICSKGRVFVEGAQHIHMVSFLHRLREIGAGFTVKANGIEFFANDSLRGGIQLETDVHPGFLTDWQQPFMVLLTQAQGASIVHETVYENRFGYVQMLKEMGAQIDLFTCCLGNRPCRFRDKEFQHSAVVKGPTPLQAKDIAIPDLRAGFAYVLAALIAEGTSHISGLEYLDRGYEQIAEKLASLGADIQRISHVKKSLEEIILPKKVAL